MNIRLAEYQEGVPVEVRCEYDPAKLDIEFVDLHYTAPVTLEARIEKGPETLSFQGCLKSKIEQMCGRCLRKVQSSVDKSFDLYYEVKGKETLETLDDLRETLMLDHPAVYLCAEDCRGLCHQCGVNLNESRCHCEQPLKNGSFVTLKDHLNHLNQKKEEKRHGKS